MIESNMNFGLLMLIPWDVFEAGPFENDRA